MSSEWQPVRLKDVTTILGDGLHGTPEYDDAGDYYFINGNNLSEGSIVLTEKTRRISEGEYLKHRKNLNDRTILVSINGTLGNVALYRGEKVILGKSACYFNVRDDVSKEFVRHLVSGPIFQDYIHTQATGSTIKNVSLKLMRDFTFKLPPLELQNRIAGILSALDDRIVLLRETNATLEAIAQALFKSWFVDFDPVRAKQQGRPLESLDPATAALFPDDFEDTELGPVPKGWAAVKLENIAKVTMGLSPKGESYNSDGNGVPLINGPVEFGDYFPVKTKWTNEASRVALADDLIFCVRGSTTGRRVISDGQYCIGRGVCAIRSINESHSFIYETINFSLARLLGKTTGSVFPSLSAPDIKGFVVLAPSETVMRAYESAVQPLIRKVQEHHRMIVTLATLRDTLLPRLISGQLRLPEAKSFVEEATA